LQAIRIPPELVVPWTARIVFQGLFASEADPVNDDVGVSDVDATPLPLPQAAITTIRLDAVGVNDALASRLELVVVLALKAAPTDSTSATGEPSGR
jgi:hypothetical protein